MKKMPAFLLSILLGMALLSAFAFPAASAGDITDQATAAFDGQGKLRLVPVMPEGLTPEVTESEAFQRILGISPDGKTILGIITEKETVVIEPKESAEDQQEEDVSVIHSDDRNNERRKKKATSGEQGPREVEKKTDRFCLIRDGELIPVLENAEKGDGDPYGNLEKLTEQMMYLPGTEGLSWSADGRYITFSNVRMQSDQSGYSIRPMNVPVVDTASGEIWLADSYIHNNLLISEYGRVILSRMSRDGAYVYYLAHRNVDGEQYYCFCRCTPDGKNREILCRTQSNGLEMPFRPLSTSNLFENPDGSWVMLGTDQPVTESDKKAYSVMVSFTPSGDSWTAEVRSTGIPSSIDPVSFAWSPVSGYGLILLDYSDLRLLSGHADSVYIPKREGRVIARHLRIIRIRPDAEDPFDVWYMNRTGESPDEVELLSGESYLEYLQACIDGQNDEKPSGLDADDGSAFDINFRTDPLIVSACISPDGRYALVKALTSDWEGDYSKGKTYCFYLIDLETMAVIPVEAPEGIRTEVPPQESWYGSQYRLDMFWNADGTVFIPGEKEDDVFFRLAVQQ